jgi:hypothetical protein
VPMEDQFTSDDLLPLVLSGHTYEGHTYEREERGTLLLLNASILVLVVSLVGMVVLLSFGNPKKVFADIEASLTDILALHPDTVHSTPTIQSTADAKALPPTESGVPARVGIAADTTSLSQADISAAPPEALLKQFQGWAAREDTRAQIETVRPVQDARAKALQNAQARFVPGRKH